jgi:hypothetical protein
MKARVKTGFSVTHYFGGFGQDESEDLALSCYDADSTVGIALKIDEK